MYKAYKDKAQFFLVYIREAHPSPEKGQADEQRAKQQLKRFGDKGITQPRTMDERVIAADANGQLVGTIGKEKVKLSDYKGKAPIVIFSSSYT